VKAGRPRRDLETKAVALVNHDALLRDDDRRVILFPARVARPAVVGMSKEHVDGPPDYVLRFEAALKILTEGPRAPVTPRKQEQREARCLQCGVRPHGVQ